MATETLTAKILGEESGLKDALRDVAQAAEVAHDKLENVGFELGVVAGASELAEENVDGLRTATGEAAGAFSSLKQNMQETEVELAELSGISMGAAESQDQVEEQTEEAARAMLQMALAANVLAASQATLSGSSEKAEESIDDAADEADDASRSFLEAAGAAQLFNLSSSALSINVGAFTVALRNATTQIPALVASLGNLASVFAGVASTAALAAAGVAGVVGAGAVAQVEQMTGEAASLEDKMQAIQGIGEEFLRMFREAMAPIIEMEGVIERFQSVLETTATVARELAQGLRRSFQAGEGVDFGLQDFMDQVGGALLDNMNDITAAFNEMFTNLGPIVANALTFVISRFDEFIEFITQISMEMSSLFSGIDGLQSFIVEMMELGRTIGAGLIPVMNIFFDVMSGIASIINNANKETVALAIEAAGLLLIMNKLSGVAATALGLFGGLPDAMTRAVVGSNGLIDSFTTMSNTIGSFISKHTAGFSRLAKTMAFITPASNGVISSMLGVSSASAAASGSIGLFSTRTGRATSVLKVLSATLRGNIAVTSALATLMPSLSSRMHRLQVSTTALKGRLSGLSNNIVGRFVTSVLSAVSSTVLWTGKILLNAAALSVVLPAVGAVAGATLFYNKVISRSTILTRLFTGTISAMKTVAVAVTTTIHGLSAAFGILQVVLSPILSVVGAVAAVLAAVVAIGGAVVLALATIGQSGESARSIFSSLRDIIISVAQEVFPVFVASANMLLDIIQGLSKPFNELLAIFGTDSGSLFDSVIAGARQFTDLLVPVLLRIGTLAERFGEVLAAGVRRAAPLIKAIAGLAKAVFSVVRGIAEAFFAVMNFVIGAVQAIDGFKIAVAAIRGILSVIVEMFSMIIDGIVAGIELIMDALRTVGEVASAVLPDFEADFGDAPALGDQEITQEQAREGAGVAREAFSMAKDTVMPGAPAPKVEYNEEGATNNYRQNIQADPEDKAQLSRIAKDAMEEANSFTRRQQGGQ